MEEGSTKCPLCGEPVNQELSSNTNYNLFNTSSNDIFKSPTLSNNKSFFPSNKPLNNEKSYFNQSSNNKKEEKKHLEKKQKYLLALIAFIILLIIVGCIIFNNSKKDEPTDDNKIELSDVPDAGTTQKPQGEKNDSENESQVPETPAAQAMRFGNYSLQIPNGYNATQENDNAITLGNMATGYIITFEAGPYNIGAYRLNDNEMKESYEKQNATVERIYDNTISSHDVHILEVDQEGTKFIIAITPSVDKKAYIITLFNGFEKDAYDYGALEEALLISDKIQLSN